MSMNKIVDEKFSDETIAAINEAKSGKNPNKVYDSVDELFADMDWRRDRHHWTCKTWLPLWAIQIIVL